MLTHAANAARVSWWVLRPDSPQCWSRMWQGPVGKGSIGLTAYFEKKKKKVEIPLIRL